MKALIIKKGNDRGRYFQGRTLKEIVKKFMKTKPDLLLIKFDEFRTRYEIFTIDTKTNRWVYYEIPKDKIFD